MIFRKLLFATAVWLVSFAGVVRANPFFAMDTGITGDPEKVAVALGELGYDGLGGSGTSVASMRASLEKQGLRLWNVYLTLKFQANASPLTPELKKLIGDLKGHDSTLWIAISEVAGKSDETAAKALTEIAGLAKESGVKISLYPHTGHWLARFSDAARLANKLDREDVGITFNLCHWLKEEGDVDPIPAIKAESKRLQFVTINGADKGDTKTMGWDKLIQTLDRGSYDVAGFVGRLQGEVGWKGPIGLQAFGVQGDRRANLARSMAAWRKMSGSLDGMVVAGYQGWFRAEGDGSGNGWVHYSSGGKFEPENTHIEIWPDMTELGPDERFPTPLRYENGKVAEVFSSVKEATVLRHFRWMREYGIDAAFLQRFATTVRNPRARESLDTVLAHCRKGANAEGRKWVLMYDLSGLKTQEFDTVSKDWLHLKEEKLWSADDAAYLRYQGKPLVALWGLGFNDRPASLPEWERLVRFFKEQGCAVMVGVPCYWRAMDQDTIKDPKLHEIIQLADVVSPWAVGRFGTPQDAANRVEKLLKPDLAWCKERNLGYLPVAFPGFSWQNLMRSRKQEAKMDAIPRLGGKFLWSQAVAARQAGSKSLYIAMFDEIDEGTAIFKVSQNPPVGAVKFLTEPGVKPDHYLWLSGEIGRMMRGLRPAVAEMPGRSQ
ncbi:TIM barrel protein [Luteolibacter sp. Populi]|uniref:TIM barrel protein n=1 Tax=Luteolibacter sp. Populi TaxID=3230487 RepID=UPI003466E55D